MFIALGEAAQDRNTAVAIIIDELQYLRDEELSSLIMAVHKISQKSLPVVVIGAGLAQLVGKAGRAKSYSERLFDYPELGPLKKKMQNLLCNNLSREKEFLFGNIQLDVKLADEPFGYRLHK